MLKRIVAIAVLPVLSLLNGVVQEESQSFPKELLGQKYEFPDDTAYFEDLSEPWRNAFERRDIYLLKNLADWSSLVGFDDERVTEVRIYGFQSLAGKRFDKTISDGDWLDLFLVGARREYATRPAVGDLDRGSGAFGGGDYLGVMSLKFDERDKPLIIGVSKSGFHLGVFHGNIHQTFFSRPLAEALSRFLKSEGLELADEDYRGLSGLHRQKLPSEFK